MTTITTQFKIHASFNIKQLMRSKVGIQVLHVKGWRPLFEFTAEDMMKLLQKKVILKRRMK